MQGFLASLKRVIGFSIKRSFGDFFRLGIEKVILIPFFLTGFGEAALGRALLVLSWTRLLTEIPTSSINNALLRAHHEHREAGTWKALLRGMLFRLWICNALIAAIGLATFYLTSQQDVFKAYLPYLLLIGPAMLLLSLRSTAFTDLSTRLKFGSIGVIEVVEGLLFLAAIPLSYSLGIHGFSVGWLLSASVGLIITINVAELLRASKQHLGPTAYKAVIKVALSFALVTAISFSIYRFARIVVGWKLGPEAVVVFFAAEAALLLIALPFQHLNNVLFSMISRKANLEEIGKQNLTYHLVGMVGSALLICGAAYLFAPYVLRWIYTEVSAEGLPILMILVPGAIGRVFFNGTLIFFHKFSSPRKITWISLISFLLFALSVLVGSSAGLSGIAYGVMIGNVLIGLVWLGLYIINFYRYNPS